MWHKLILLFSLSAPIFSYDSSRIIGGADTDISQAPYMASILINGRFICSGSILNVKIILTAAHCLLGSPSIYQIRAGSSLYSEGGQLRRVLDVSKHPNYKPPQPDYDVGFLTLVTELQVTNLVQPVPINEPPHKPEINDTALVRGWGALLPDGDPSLFLQTVEVKIWSRADCQEAWRVYPWRFTITEHEICAGSNGRDLCGESDAGAPLLYNGSLIGVASSTFGCGDPEFPGIYMGVETILKFIRDTI